VRREKMLISLVRPVMPGRHRHWLDALLAEAEGLQPARSRLIWLLGAGGLLAAVYARLLVALVTPASVLLFSAAVFFAVLSQTEFEAFGEEEDWYWLAAVSAIGLIGVCVKQLRRNSPGL
jgi:drug/metabolite transporter (DMT)-like permease